MLWFARTGNREPHPSIGGHRGKRAIHVLPIKEVWVRNRRELRIGKFFKQTDDVVGLVIRQRIEQHAVHD